MTERQKIRRLHWLGYQQRLIDDLSDYVLVEKSRRVGFDYSEAYKHTMLRLKHHARHLWYTSADESAAFEFVEYCRFFAERVYGVVDYFTEDLPEAEDNKGAIKAFCLKFANGARINALSSSPRRMRSKGGDVLISEFAWHDNPGVLYDAAMPVIMWGDRLEIGSTHNGEGSIFNQFCQDARKYAKQRGGQSPQPAGVGRPLTPWSHHFQPITLAVEQGIVEQINAERGKAMTREQFLQRLRAGCRTEDQWLQEFMCVPSCETSAWLPYDLIRTCEDAQCPGMDQPLYRGGQSPEARYAGIDVGRHQDLTVLTILGKAGDVLWTRRVLTLAKMPIPDQVRILEGALREARAQRTCVDATGLGIGISDGLKERLGDYAVEAVTFTGPVKERLAVPVRTRFEDRTIRIPDDARLREGLHKVRKTVTAAGNVRFEAERDAAGHADEFWAVALGIEAAGTSDECWAMVA